MALINILKATYREAKVGEKDRLLSDLRETVLGAAAEGLSGARLTFEPGQYSWETLQSAAMHLRAEGLVVEVSIGSGTVLLGGWDKP